MDKLAHRKASRVLRIVDANGKPAANQTVRLQLKNHEFLFGCGAFESLPYTNAPRKDEAFAARMEDRMAKWLGLFNYGTLPFYWGRFEGEEGKPMTAEYTRAAEFLRSKDVTPKGHPLCWQTAGAQWLLKYDNDTILR